MTWFLLVLFAQWEEVPAFVFTNPTFETQEECITSLKNPVDVEKYVHRLVIEFARPMPIVGVACINEEQLMQDLAPYLKGQAI
jgi:hypothetical protein